MGYNRQAEERGRRRRKRRKKRITNLRAEKNREERIEWTIDPWKNEVILFVQNKS